MLDQETKRRIDTARDILVGKVPDPKAQVEQITTALIYKFMDDMDHESIEMGGRAGFLILAYKYIYKTNSSNYDPAKDIPTFAQTDDRSITELQIQSNGRYKGDQFSRVNTGLLKGDSSPEMSGPVQEFLKTWKK